MTLTGRRSPGGLDASSLRDVLLAQITDCHIVEPGDLMSDRVDTAAMLRAAVADVTAMTPRPDVVLATGDLVNDGRPAQYEHLGEILADLTMPVYPIPGNHDVRDGIRKLFPDVVPPVMPADSASDWVDYVVDEHPIRLVGLDTTIPGEPGGRLEPEQLVWLDEQLAREPDRPTLIFQHHPPFATGIDWMDRVGLENGRQEADVVARHPQVELLTCGHVHRAVHTRFGGTTASCWPSTCVQIALALDGTPYGLVDEPPGYALHRWDAQEGVASHFSYVDGPDSWQPPWAEEAIRSTGS